MEPATATAEEVVAAEAQESAAPAAVTAEEEAQEEAPAEAGLVDIASILGAPTVTVVRSSL
jgi:predicted secreted protein